MDISKYMFIKSMVTDNPSIMLNDSEYVNRLKALPPALRDAFLYGSWDAILGSFFELDPGMEESPFEIQESAMRKSGILSIDHGLRHSTSAGLHWVDERGIIHRLWSYQASGFDAATHAAEIADRMMSFPHTRGAPPAVIVYDPSMAGETKVTANVTISPLREYLRVFTDKHINVSWEPAINARIFGSQLMQSYFKDPTIKQPKYKIWTPYCSDFRVLLSQIMCDKHNAEAYLKEETPSDDLADEVRYCICHAHQMVSSEKEMTEAKNRIRVATASHQKKDWYSM